VRFRSRSPEQHLDRVPTLGRRAFVAGAVAALAGCGGASSLAFIGGRKVDAGSIDADPLAVLPSDVVMLTYLDLQAAFRSSVGGDFNSLISSFVPLGPESNFSAARDTTRFFGGLYAMQGIDFCGVIQGRFDVASIARAADARAAAGGTSPLVKSRYADCDVYTLGNLGFSLLTPQTMLSGNETGIRRALDRLRKPRITRNIPAWMLDTVATPGAHLAIAGDFGADTVTASDSTGRVVARPPAGAAAAAALPALESASRGFSFLDGVRVIRAFGQFAPPGVNVVGSITYDSDGRAEAGSAALAHVGDLNPIMNLLMSVGLGASIRNPQVARTGRDVAFIEPIEDGLLRAAFSYIRR
jgi:hypothetical protein